MDLINLAKAALLGILQGLTEFLPVSSTGHLLIGEELIGYEDPGGVFTVMIQLGSILAVMWLYRARILEVIVGLPTKPEARRFALILFLAFLPDRAGDWRGRVSDARFSARRFALRRDDFRRPPARARPARGGGVFVLSRDAHDDGRVRA
jgi:hypothetical protein